MIILDNDYVIIADTKCYMLQKNTKKDGVRTTIAYCTTLEYAIKKYTEVLLQNDIMSKDYMLGDILDEIKKINKKISEFELKE